MHIDVWKQALKDQLKESGLPASIRRLVKDTVTTFRLRILIEQNAVMCKQLSKAIGNQQ